MHPPNLFMLTRAALLSQLIVLLDVREDPPGMRTRSLAAAPRSLLPLLFESRADTAKIAFIACVLERGRNDRRDR